MKNQSSLSRLFLALGGASLLGSATGCLTQNKEKPKEVGAETQKASYSGPALEGVSSIEVLCLLKGKEAKDLEAGSDMSKVISSERNKHTSDTPVFKALSLLKETFEKEKEKPNESILLLFTSPNRGEAPQASLLTKNEQTKKFSQQALSFSKEFYSSLKKGFVLGQNQGTEFKLEIYTRALSQETGLCDLTTTGAKHSQTPVLMLIKMSPEEEAELKKNLE